MIEAGLIATKSLKGVVWNRLILSKSLKAPGGLSARLPDRNLGQVEVAGASFPLQAPRVDRDRTKPGSFGTPSATVRSAAVSLGQSFGQSFTMSTGDSSMTPSIAVAMYRLGVSQIVTSSTSIGNTVSKSKSMSSGESLSRLTPRAATECLQRFTFIGLPPDRLAEWIRVLIAHHCAAETTALDSNAATYLRIPREHVGVGIDDAWRHLPAQCRGEGFDRLGARRRAAEHDQQPHVLVLVEPSNRLVVRNRDLRRLVRPVQYSSCSRFSRNQASTFCCAITSVLLPAGLEIAPQDITPHFFKMLDLALFLSSFVEFAPSFSDDVGASNTCRMRTHSGIATSMSATIFTSGCDTCRMLSAGKVASISIVRHLEALGDRRHAAPGKDALLQLAGPLEHEAAGHLDVGIKHHAPQLFAHDDDLACKRDLADQVFIERVILMTAHAGAHPQLPAYFLHSFLISSVCSFASVSMIDNLPPQPAVVSLQRQHPSQHHSEQQ